MASCPAGHQVPPSQAVRCRQCRRDQVIGIVSAADRSLPREVIETAVAVVAPSGQALRQLALALNAEPAALSRGAPPVAGKLAAELAARGSAVITVPSCAACGRTGRPLFRGEAGTGVCQRCRAWQLASPCATCGKVKPASGRDEHGKAVCEVCRRRDNPGRHRECGTCGKTAPLAVRGRDGDPGTCVNCYQLPEATCSRCRRRRPCRAASGLAACPSCSPRATAVCAHCGNERPPSARWPEGPVCDPCYRTALQHRGPCARCGQRRRLVAPPGPGADTCADCAGVPVISACGDCGTEDKLYEKGRCARCSLRRRARVLLSAGTGAIAPELNGVFDAIVSVRQPRSALNWLRNGAGSALLGDVAGGRLAVSHEALDAHPRQRAADYLRHMLTAAGALPPRDEGLARAARWLEETLASVSPPADRRLVRAYATWQVMRRLRAGHAGRPLTPTETARNNIRAAVNLLAWLRSRGTTLADTGQGDIDQWLRTGPSAILARDFLTWSASRGRCRPVTVPVPARASGPAISQDQRWALISRLLGDTTADPTDRVAGCLLLLYGQPLSRIAAMTTSQVIHREGETFLLLGHHEVPAPGSLASAIRDLAGNGRSHRGIGSPAATGWLFPGHMPGRPITPSRLGERLRAIGIYAQRGRRAALLALAAQMPAAVLADALGLHQTTTAKWMHQAGGDWSRYAADLARHPHQT